MPLDSIANISISLQAPPATRASFGIGLAMGDFSPAQEALFGADLTAEVLPQNWETTLTALGFTSSDPLWIFTQRHFGQDRVPERLIIGRRATVVAQVNTYLVTGATDGTYTITINGNDYSFVASGSTVAAIRDALVIAVNGGSDPVTAAPGGAGELTVTADQAGIAFVSATSSTGDPITDTPTTPNVGIVDDLVAMNAETGSWYYVHEVDRDIEEGVVLAQSIESFSRDIQGMLQTDDPLAQSTDALTDLGGRLSALNLLRTAVCWYPSDAEFQDAALSGKMLPSDPGSETWANQALRLVAGISVNDDLASESRLLAKNYNFLEAFPAATFAMTRGGTVASGQFIDVVRLRDHIKNEMQLRYAEALRDNGKIPYTDGGGDILASIARGTLEDFADSGGVVADSIDVQVPLVANQADADRGNRHFPGITWAATLQGAVHSLDVAGSLSP